MYQYTHQFTWYIQDHNVEQCQNTAYSITRLHGCNKITTTTTYNHFWPSHRSTSVSPHHQLTDRVVVLCPTRHKIGHFGDVIQANLLGWYGKLNPTQQKHTFANQKKCTITQNKHKQTKPGLVASYDIQPGNGRGPILVLGLHKFVTYLLT